MNAPVHRETLITRRAPLGGATSWDPETRTFTAIIAAGAGVERWDERGRYVEMLDPKGMRPAPSVPLLNSHQRFDLSSVIGAMASSKIVDGRIEAVLRLSRRADVESIGQDIADQIITATSVGYRVDAWREETDPNTKLRTKTATKWTLLEISLVPLPADPNARIRGEVEMNHAPAASAVEPVITPSAPTTQTRADINTGIRSIAELAGLDRTWADTQIDAERGLEEVRTAAFEEMNRQRAAPGQIRSTNVQVIANHDDPAVRIRSAGEAFYARYTPGHQLSEPARQFAGMTTLDMARECTRAAGIATTGLSAATIVQRALHSTADFSLILGDAIGRTLRASYSAAPSGLKLVARQTTAKDFRDKHRLSLSEAPRLEKVNESGEFKSGTLAEAKESYRLATYGRVIGITRQVLINDDLGAFTDLARRMGQAAAATEAQLLVDLLLANSGSGPTMSDGSSLFHANHKNKASAGAAPSVPTLSDARTAMRRQVGLKGELIEVAPRFLIIPPELETGAEQLLASLAATTTTDVNPFSGKLVPVVEPRLTSATRWYLAADSASIDGLEFAYLEGEEGVQIETKAGFEVDGVQIKARLDFGAGFVDHRGWFMNAGA